MYLRTIYELEEEGIVPLRARIAERLHQSGPTVSQTVARMERDELLRVEGDRHLELTDEGRSRAIRVMRKHRLAERLLIDSDSRALGGEWVGPGHPSFVKVGEGLYEMYLHAWPRAGGIFTPVHNAEYREGRKVIHRYVSFRDARGNRCEPYVVDDSVVVEG